MKLPSLVPEQLIHLKAKVTNLQTTWHVRENTNIPLQKREALLLDTTGTIKVVVWASDGNLVENEKKYKFKTFA